MRYATDMRRWKAFAPKRRWVLMLTLVVLLVGTFGAATAVAQNPERESVLYRAVLDGGSEVPPVATAATGRASFKWGVEEGVIRYEVQVEDIVGITQAHIHLGPAGANGPVVAFLFGPSSPPVSIERGVLASGEIAPEDLIGPLSGNFPGLIAAMEAGQIYTNVHTVANPGGHIRGQNFRVPPRRDTPTTTTTMPPTTTTTTTMPPTTTTTTTMPPTTTTTTTMPPTTTTTTTMPPTTTTTTMPPTTTTTTTMPPTTTTTTMPPTTTTTTTMPPTTTTTTTTMPPTTTTTTTMPPTTTTTTTMPPTTTTTTMPPTTTTTTMPPTTTTTTTMPPTTTTTTTMPPTTTTTTTMPPTTTTTTTMPPTTTTTTQPPGQVQATIFDFGYAPNPINITVGTAVRWTNTGMIHSTTSDDWDSGILDTDQTFTYTFTEAGTFAYFCTVHPGLMVGTINVAGG